MFVYVSYYWTGETLVTRMSPCAWQEFQALALIEWVEFLSIGRDVRSDLDIEKAKVNDGGWVLARHS